MRLSRLLAVAVAAAAFAAVAPSAHAASDYFLKVDGIPGESMGLPGYIDIQSFAMGVENQQTISATTGGFGSGKATFNALEVDKWVDSTTPALFTRATSGQKIPAVEIVARKAASANAPYLRYCFQNVFVTGQDVSGGDDVEEKLQLVYGSVTQQYTKQNKDGSLQTGLNGTVTSSWSLLTNTIAKEAWPANNACSKAA